MDPELRLYQQEHRKDVEQRMKRNRMVEYDFTTSMCPYKAKYGKHDFKPRMTTHYDGEVTHFGVCSGCGKREA